MATTSLLDLEIERIMRMQREASVEAARRGNERTEWLQEKQRRLESLIDFANDEMWVLTGFEKLKGGPTLGNGSCAVLPQLHGGLPMTKYWKAGPPVHGNAVILPYGTAIATFVNGVYPNWETGNHAAIFGSDWSGLTEEGKLASGIVMFDQWKNKKGGPGWRLVLYGDGVSDRSNDAAAFSVILTAKARTPTGDRIPVRTRIPARI